MKLFSDRRHFLIGAGAAASASLMCKSLLNPTMAQAAAFVRKDIGTLSATDPVIVSYRKAVKAMQALSASDPNNPLGWTYQAAMHATTASGSHPGWNGCQHGNYYFWPWHRMYIYWFERIIRKMSGDPTFALPFWNWSSATERHLPAMFRDTSSELYTSHRNAAMNNGTGSLPAGDVSYASAFSFTDFTSASASLEGTPHGAVHVDVGGWMGSVPTAGQDPIFYLHHCNIDRLWNLWLAQGGRQDPLSDSTWKTHSFLFFDENGATVHMTPCDVLRASNQLNYTYAGEPAQVSQSCLRLIPWPIWKWIILVRFPLPPIELTADPRKVPLDLSALRDKLTAVARDQSQTLVLKLEGVEADRQPGAVWEVYLGDGAQTPDSPNFVGNIALFGAGIRSEAQMGFQPASFSFPVRGKLLEMLLQNPKVSLSFVPHGVLVDGKPSRPQIAAPVKIGAVSLSVGTRSKQ